MYHSGARPLLVWPIHDPQGLVLPHIAAILPDLKTLFSGVFAGVTAATLAAHAGAIARLEADAFFSVLVHPARASLGDQFLSLYRRACDGLDPERLLHLCFPDRVVFALRSHHREAFVRDMLACSAWGAPLLYQRSEAAWASHPANYATAERLGIHLCALVVGRPLDLAWCHLAVPVARLAAILPVISRRDMALLAEIVWLLREDLITRDVDWLAWEDPFLLGQEAESLRREREASAEETRKRLAYVQPILEMLFAAHVQGVTS
ncbi:MAG: hypothetical protein JXB35_07615 [Anaerolineae bacterium]|nr:hypothetical protein [Anaerolineae bacterium]